jgi:Rab proteins geranylgeranyltransferase component A
LDSLLAVIAEEGNAPKCLFHLYYEQAYGGPGTTANGNIFTFPSLLSGLAFNDGVLDPVRQAWIAATGASPEDAETGYMVFEDREGVGNDDDIYD